MSAEPMSKEEFLANNKFAGVQQGDQADQERAEAIGVLKAVSLNETNIASSAQKVSLNQLMTFML